MKDVALGRRLLGPSAGPAAEAQCLAITLGVGRHGALAGLSEIKVDRRVIAKWISGSIAFLGLAACGPRLPDDLPTLMTLMNSNDQATSVNASNKVSEMYGSNGLLRVLREGQSTARAKAARWLWRFPGDEVEQSLIQVVETETDDFLRVQALSSLEKLGTDRALPAIEAATHDPDEHVASSAREAVSAIRSRVPVQ